LKQRHFFLPKEGDICLKKKLCLKFGFFFNLIIGEIFLFTCNEKVNSLRKHLFQSVEKFFATKKRMPEISFLKEKEAFLK